jgi:hypothetical protein
VRNVSDKVLLLLLLTAIGLMPGGSGYFTCIQNMTLVTTKFKSGGLSEKLVVVETIKTHFMLSNFFSLETCAFYNVIWKNSVELNTPQTTIWRVRFAC